MTSAIRTVVIDDHPLFREGVANALSLDSQITVVAQGASFDEALALVKQHLPDVVLLDISLPDASGIKAAAAISSLPAPPRILMLTVSNVGDDVRNAIKAGAAGYILKGVNAKELIQAIKTVSSGNHYVTPSITFELLSPPGARDKSDLLTSLTAKEREVLNLMAAGLRNQDIGQKLSMTEKTVKYHLYNAFRKLGVHNRVQAAQLLSQAI